MSSKLFSVVASKTPRRSFFQLVICSVIGMLGLMASRTITAEEKPMSRVFQLRTYTTLPGRLPALEQRFKDHTLKLFEKHGMKNEMYWRPTDEKLKDNTLIYVVSHDSAEAAKKSWEGFRGDPEWIKVRDASEKDGKIVEKVDSVNMESLDWTGTSTLQPSK